MKDFSFWKEYEGASEGSGRSEKIWLMNPDTEQIGLFKFKKDETTTDHISECVAYELAKMIGIPCAKFELGTYNGREGSISYNIVNQKDMALIEGIYCISLIYPNFDAEKIMDIETGEKYSIEMIKNVLEPLKLFDEFLPVLIFDFLIGNTDRHQSNWALLREGNNLRISPLYDNSSSLCAYVKPEKIKKYLGKDAMLWKSLVDTKSRSIIRIQCKDMKQPTHLEVLKFLRENYYAQTVGMVTKIEKLVTEEKISDILEHYRDNLSKEKSELIKKYLLSKIQMMSNVYKEKEEKHVC